MAIVYLHKKKYTQEVFYVGIGAMPKRAYTKYKRTQLWLKIANKYGYDIEITHKDLVWEEACSIEKYLISFYGRIDIETGTLANMTDGGDGTYGRLCSKSTKEKISKKAKDLFSDKTKHPMYGKKQTLESKQKNRDSQTREKSAMFGKIGINHPMYGYKYTKEQIKQIKIRNSGANNPNFGNRGGKNSLSKKVIGYKNGKYFQYNSIIQASNDTKCAAQTISNCCLKKQYQTNGYRFKFYNDDSFIGEMVKQKRVLSEKTKEKIKISLLGKKRGKYGKSHKSITTIN